ncbi:hypothetical protein [Nocardioides marmoraquaticus]
MTNLVPAEDIQRIVGARRHPLFHLGRAASDGETVYILHSKLCRDFGIDLRDCPFSLALDEGIDLLGDDWTEDVPLGLAIVDGRLKPVAHTEGLVHVNRTAPVFSAPPMTFEQLRPTFELQPNGVQLALLGEDRDAGAIALGDITAADMQEAATNALAFDVEVGSVTRRWGLFREHRGDCELLEHRADCGDAEICKHTADWVEDHGDATPSCYCVDAERPSEWWVTFSDAPHPPAGAIRITHWEG